MSDSGSKRPSWRDKPKTTPAAPPSDTTGSPQSDPAAGTSAANTDRASGSAGSKAKRFHGGRYSQPTTGSRSYRLFASFTALSLVLLAMVAAVWMLVARDGAKPLLVAWSVTDYESPLIPPNDFAFRDVALLQMGDQFAHSGEGMRQDTTNMQTEQEFRLFFEQTLPAIDADTLVVYLSAHGVSDEREAFLLTSEASPDSNVGRYPLRMVLEQMAAAKPRKKLLVLDSTRINANLDLGLLGNDFVWRLKQDFARLEKQIASDSKFNPRQQFAVLCSSSDGERAWASMHLEHSVFGLVTTYALRGGDGIDRPGHDLRIDGMLDTEEIADFVTQHVSAWAPRFREATQQPVFLSIGEPFALVEVDPEMTSAQLMAESRDLLKPKPPETPTPAEASKEEEKGTAAAKEQAPPPPAEPKAPPEPKKEDILARLQEFWVIHERIASDPPVLARPLLWALFEQDLLRCERLILAGEWKQANVLLEGPITEISERLKQAPPGVTIAPWNLPAPSENESPEMTKQREAIQAVLAKPDAASLAALESVKVAEADLVRFFAKYFRNGDTWANPELVRFAVETESKLVGILNPNRPQLLPFVQNSLASSTAQFRDGEADVVLRRVPQAFDHFRRAAAEAERTDAEAHRVETEYLRLEQTLGSAPSLLRWLGSDPAQREDRNVDLRKLDEFFTSLDRYGTEPEINNLVRAARSASELRQQAVDYAQTAWQRNGWRQSRASLDLTFLDPDLRRHLLDTLLNYHDESPLDRMGEIASAKSINVPANPFPLAPYFAALGESESFVEQLEKLSPSHSRMMTQGEVMENEGDRLLRAEVGERVRQKLQQMRARPFAETTGTPWQQEIRHRLASSFRTNPQVVLQPDDPVMTRLLRTARVEQIRWLVERFQKADQNLPEPVYAGIIRNLVETARGLDPAFRLPSTPVATLQMVSSGNWKVPADGKGEFALVLRANKEVSASRNATLYFDWIAGDTALSVDVDGKSASKGQLAIPLGQVAADSEKRLNVKIQSDADTMKTPPHFMARVAFGDGPTEWLPIDLDFQTAEKKPLELVVKGLKESGRDYLLTMLPNQEAAFPLAVRKNAAGEMNARLEFLSDSVLVTTLPLTFTEKQSGVVPVPPPPQLAMPLAGSQLELRLYLGEALLQTATIRTEILDPVAYLQPTLEYDPRARLLRVTLERTRSVPQAAPIPVSLAIAGVDVKQGILAGEIPPDQNRAVLEARIPTDVADRELTALISVSGVPRAFRYLFGVTVPRGRPQQSLSVHIVAPTHESNLNPDASERDLTAQLEVDGPDATPLSTHLGIDRNGNGELDASERLASEEFLKGRQVSLELLGREMPPEFAIRAKVGDINLSLPIQGLHGRQMILAHVLGGNQSKLASSQVHFLSSAPEIRVDEPLNGSPVQLGQPLWVSVRGVDPDFASAIDAIRVGFDTNSNGSLDADEMVVPIGQTPGKSMRLANNQIRVQVPTDQMKPGRQLLTVTAVTKVVDSKSETGTRVLESKPVQRTVVLIAPQMTSKEEKAAPPTTGRIEGKVLLGAQGKKGVKVLIAGVGEATTGQNGEFAFEKVPPGNYQVIAEAYQRGGQAAVTVAPGKTASVEVSLSLK